MNYLKQFIYSLYMYNDLVIHRIDKLSRTNWLYVDIDLKKKFNFNRKSKVNLLSVYLLPWFHGEINFMLHGIFLCCNKLSAFPCPESKLEPGCIGFIMFDCDVESSDKIERELCSKLDILFCCIFGTEPSIFIDCNWGFSWFSWDCNWGTWDWGCCIGWIWGCGSCLEQLTWLMGGRVEYE